MSKYVLDCAAANSIHRRLRRSGRDWRPNGLELQVELALLEKNLYYQVVRVFSTDYATVQS